MSGKSGMFTRKRRGKIPQVIFWTDEDCLLLMELWQQGAGLAKIKARFSHYGTISSGVIYGKVWRLRNMVGKDRVGVRKPLTEATREKRRLPKELEVVDIAVEEVLEPPVMQERVVQEIDLRGVPRKLAGNRLGLFSGDFGPGEF